MPVNCCPVFSSCRRTIDIWISTRRCLWRASDWYVVSAWNWSSANWIKIVEKKSAILGLPDTRETKVGLNANHEAICQFASEDSETYKHVSSLIVDFVHSAMAVTKNGLDKKPSLVESFESLNTTLVDNDWVEVDEPGFCGCLLERMYNTYTNRLWYNSHDTLSTESRVCQPQACYWEIESPLVAYWKSTFASSHLWPWWCWVRLPFHKPQTCS